MKRAWLMIACLAGLMVQADDIVENREKPSGKPMTLRLTEELRFGAEEDADEYFWALLATSVTMDKDLNIYVTDPKDGRCLKFNKEGQFLEQVIRKGEGPGEVTNLARLKILKDGGFVALGSGPGAMPGFHYFDKEFNFLSTSVPKGFKNIPQLGVFSPDGTKLASRFSGFDMQGGMTIYTGVIDKEFEALKVFSEFTTEMNPQKFGEIGYLRDFFAKMITLTGENNTVFAYDQKGHLYSARTNRYEIIKWNADMTEPMMTIKRDYKPIRNPVENQRAMIERILEPFAGFPNLNQLLTDQNLDRMVEDSEMPLVKNPIFGIIPMEDGHLLVAHDVDMTTGEQTVDIFSPDGKFIGQKTMGDWAFMGLDGLPRMQFLHGKAITILTDDVGDNRAVRYHVQIVPQ